MSNQTQEKRPLSISIAFLSVLMPLLANAGPVSDAQESLNKAYDDYYDAVSTGGTKTPEEQKALRQRIVDPAMATLNQAMKQEADAVVKEHAKNLPAKPGAIAGASDPSFSAPVKEAAPEVSLDGSDIPRELEFPGKPVQPKPTSTALAPAKADPYLGPYAPKSH